MPFTSVQKVADADFPTRWGHFRILGFEGLTQPGDPTRKPVESAVALVMGGSHGLTRTPGARAGFFSQVFTSAMSPLKAR